MEDEAPRPRARVRDRSHEKERAKARHKAWAENPANAEAIAKRRQQQAERARLRYQDPEKRRAQQEYAREKRKRELADETLLAKKRERERLKYEHDRYTNPERYAARQRENQKRYSQKRRAVPENHPGTCDICGILPEPHKNGNRGLSQDHRHDTGEIRGYLCSGCNTMMAAFDLRFSDPERFARMTAYSARGAPVVLVPVTKPKRRKKAVPHPTLFGEPEDR